MMNATQAMKMNITFCSSPIPKSEKVSGIRAATGAHPAEGGQQVARQTPVEPEAVKAGKRLPWAGQPFRRRDDPLLGLAPGDKPPECQAAPDAHQADHHDLPLRSLFPQTQEDA